MRQGLLAVFAARPLAGPSGPQPLASPRRRTFRAAPPQPAGPGEDLLVCSERRHFGGVFKKHLTGKDP